jgi:Rrf2 family transcriptional regulator, cysteine metabolism repressor
MQISSKCYYALRAIYALAENGEPVPMKIAQVSEQQQIPLKFLEAILNHLKSGGFVQSWRGPEGGYRLARPAGEITVGEVLRFVDGPIAPVDCVSHSRPSECTFHGECPFFEFWGDVRQAISNVVDRTTFADLVQRNRSRKRETNVAQWDL